MIRYALATAADAPLIHEMLVEMAAGEGAAISATPAALLKYGFGPTPRFRAILAQDTITNLGFCLFLPEYSSWRGMMGLFVQDLYLRPEARGKGLGKGLLKAAWQASTDWTPEFLALNVKRSNTAAIGFYQSLGFTLRDSTDPLILTGEGLAALR